MFPQTQSWPFIVKQSWSILFLTSITSETRITYVPAPLSRPRVLYRMKRYPVALLAPLQILPVVVVFILQRVELLVSHQCLGALALTLYAVPWHLHVPESLDLACQQGSGIHRKQKWIVGNERWALRGFFFFVLRGRIGDGTNGTERTHNKSTKLCFRTDRRTKVVWWHCGLGWKSLFCHPLKSSHFLWGSVCFYWSFCLPILMYIWRSFAYGKESSNCCSPLRIFGTEL